jgi:hypothetical protein
MLLEGTGDTTPTLSPIDLIQGFLPSACFGAFGVVLSAFAFALAVGRLSLSALYHFFFVNYHFSKKKLKKFFIFCMPFICSNLACVGFCALGVYLIG